MSRPDLYRWGDTNSPRLRGVRIGIDVDVRPGDNDNIIIGSGGVSLFDAPHQSWSVSDTWILPKTAAIAKDLQAMNDHGPHWLLTPVVEMPFKSFVDSLAALGFQRVTVYSASGKEEPTATFIPPPPHNPVNQSKAVRFVADALSSVFYDRTPIADWDDNDYAYIGILAAALDSGKLDLETLQWHGTVSVTSKAQRFVARAVTARMTVEREQLSSVEDEDAEAEMANDHALLLNALHLFFEENPLREYLPEMYR